METEPEEGMLAVEVVWYSALEDAESTVPIGIFAPTPPAKTALPEAATGWSCGTRQIAPWRGSQSVAVSGSNCWAK